MRRMFVIALCLVVGACGQSTKPEATKPEATAVAAPEVTEPEVTVTTATFEPLYRASKTVQGATASGVTYVKFGELMQTFSTEMGIAKDHQLNASDQELLALYQTAYDAYHDSHTVWAEKFARGGGDGLLSISPSMEDMMRVYNVEQATEPFKHWSVDLALQTIWKEAGARLNGATAVYLGKPLPAA